MDSLTQLVVANVLFVLSHFAMSHPLRAPMVRALGDKGFMGVYSLVSLGLFAWIVVAFRAVGPSPAPAGNAAWIVASLLTVVATALLIGSFKGNPALPDTSVDAVARAEATGAFAVTRHPMMWAIALWGAAHLAAWPSARTLVTAGAMVVLALVGSHLQDRKKQVLLGAAWHGWEAKTSYWPRLGKLGALGAGPWIGGTALWLAATWAHEWAAGMPAGVWRWVG